MIGASGLLMNTPSCSATELFDVQFRDNQCSGVCVVELSAENRLEDIRFDGNIGFGVEDVPTLLHAPPRSQTSARQFVAMRNEAAVFVVENASHQVSQTPRQVSQAPLNCRAF